MNCASQGVSLLLMLSFAWVTASATRCVAADPSERAHRAVVAALTGRSEPRRVQIIRGFAGNSSRRNASIDAIIEATESQVVAAADLKQVPGSTHELIRLLGKIDRPTSRECLIGLLDAETPELVMTAIDTLGERRCFEAIAALQKQVQHPSYETSYGFRFNLVRALIRMDHPEAYEFLGTLEQQLDGQLHYEASKLLDEVDVDDFRGDQERFLKWQRATGRAAPEAGTIQLTSNSGSERRISLAQSHYYGIPIHAKRMVFVIDCSDSMEKRTYHGTRWSEAKRELIQAITPLSSDSEFTVIAYHERVLVWQSELQIASEENKRRAIQYIGRLSPDKATNTYGALRAAMRLNDNLEAMFVLSDGRPNRGEISQPSLIVRDISHRNRFRNMNINTIGISVSGDTEMFMKRLAENNAGEFRAVE